MVAYIRRHKTARPQRSHKPHTEVEFEIEHGKLTGSQIKRFLHWYYDNLKPSQRGIPRDIQDSLRKASSIGKEHLARMKQDDEYILPGRTLKQSAALKALDKKRKPVATSVKKRNVVRIRVRRH